MSEYQVAGISDFRNEGWGLAGSGVTHCVDAWSSSDDTKYCSCPANKGRAAIVFQQDISVSNIPAGSIIESVTVYVRAAKTDSAARTLTVNLLPADCTNNFTTRTFPLTQTPFTYTVGTYTVDAKGRPWTRETLNQLVVQCFSYCGVADKVRVYEAYVTVDYRVQPSITLTAPTGTVNSAAPVVSWNYVQPDGDIQASAEYKVFTAAQQESPSFNPDTWPSAFQLPRTYKVRHGDTLSSIAAAKLGDASLWPSIVQISDIHFRGCDDRLPVGIIINIPTRLRIVGDITSFTLPFALPKNDYYVYVKATSTRGAQSPWSDSAFTVSGASPGAPGGSLGGVGTGGGGGFESVIADPDTSNVFMAVRDGSNLLSLQQADFEIPGDTLGWTAVNATLAEDLTQCYDTGAASMSITATSTSQVTVLSSFYEVDEDAPVTISAQWLAITTGRVVSTGINCYDDTFTLLGTINSAGTDSTSTWTQVVEGTATTPWGTSYAQAELTIQGQSIGEVHNVDQIGLMYGTNSAWSNGGHASRNLLTSAQSTADDPITVEPFAAQDTASTYARVANSGTGADGTKAFQMTYAGITPTISYVATGTAFTDTTTGTGFTLNKPSGVANGDVLVAYVATDAGVVTTAPVGWVVVSTVSNSGTSLSVLMRDGLAADASTWVGVLNASATRKRAFVVAYRGAAPTASQFSRKNTASSLTGSLVQQTASVLNSDANAWRLSSFAVADNVSGGAVTANILPTGAFTGIQYVGVAGAFKYQSATANSHFTINRPSGVQANDLMIATVSIAGTCSFTTPTGWTLVNSGVYGTVGYPDTGTVSTAIYKRTVGTLASEPTSWMSTHTGAPAPYGAKMSQCVAYRNCADASVQFIDQDTAGSSDMTYSTSPVTNTDARAWRVCSFTNVTTGGSTMTSNEISERYDGTTSGADPAVNIALYDSNGPVPTGSHVRTATSSSFVWGEVNWIGIIKPATGTPPTTANETERQDATAGASSSYVTLAGYDSNGVSATGSFNVYGTFVPGSGTTVTAGASWLGFLSPLAATVQGEAGCTLASFVDISNVSPDVLTRAGGQVTVQSSFLGSTAGVPHLKLYAYSGTELISTQVAEGAPFNASTWSKAAQTFALPVGATRLKMGVSAEGRAVADTVMFDRVSMAFGADTAYHPGTGNAAHPIFDAPLVEFAEDLGTGYGDWQDLPYQVGVAPKYDNVTGVCEIIDQTMTPLSHRKYRARTISYGLSGDSFISPYGPESQEVTLVAGEWWLKDLTVPELSMKLKVFADPLKVTTTDSSTAFQPLSRPKPIIVTEGYKGDVITLTIQVRSADFINLTELFAEAHTVYLQSNLDKSWWVRPFGDIESEVQLTGDMHEDPLRFVAVTFMELDSGV